jgi:hypothetical protein
VGILLCEKCLKERGLEKTEDYDSYKGNCDICLAEVNSDEKK